MKIKIKRKDLLSGHTGIKIYLFIISVVLAVALLATSTASATGTETISIGSATVNPGDTVVLPITIADVTDVTGVTLTIVYDVNIVTIQNVVANSSVVTGSGVYPYIDNTIGKATIPLTNTNSITTTSAIPIIDITFGVVGNSGSSILELQEVELSDDSFNVYVPDTINNGEIIIVTVIINDQDENSGGSSSGGGGGGSSGEAYDHIEVKDVIREYITIDSVVTYEFKEDANAIGFVSFDAKTNAGYITATVEVLKGTSALVLSAPLGEVYQNMNIWIGKAGYATENNIANPVIGFKVARSWIATNNIDDSTIKLNRYSDGNWNPLATSLVDEDTDNLYFESVTSGFSPFAITAEKKKAEAGGEGIVPEPVTGVEESELTPETTLPEEDPGIPGFGSLACLSIVLVTAQLLRKKR